MFYIPIHQLMDLWVICTFSLLCKLNTRAMDICFQVLVWTCVSFPHDCILRGGIAGSSGNLLFDILRKCQTICQGGFTLSHSYQQHMMVSLAPHSQCHFSDLFILAISLCFCCDIMVFFFDIHYFWWPMMLLIFFIQSFTLMAFWEETDKQMFLRLSHFHV